MAILGAVVVLGVPGVLAAQAQPQIIGALAVGAFVFGGAAVSWRIIQKAVGRRARTPADRRRGRRRRGRISACRFAPQSG